MNFRLTRRELLASLLSAPLVLSSGCSRERRLPPQGEIIGPSVNIGHRIRNGGLNNLQPTTWRDVEVLIIGGGIAGLSAAWRLQMSGVQDFSVLELEPSLGGTSRSGQSTLTAYPWGAHYVPVPNRENRALIRLFEAMGVLESIAEDGTPIGREEFLCRDPDERVFFEGEWHEGLYPGFDATEEDLSQLERFQAEIDRWIQWRDSSGRRAFVIPVATCSEDPEVMELDRLSMADWLEERNFTSERLLWLIDYSCRDDYGMTVDQTSAWAGLFYFASRRMDSSTEYRPLLTWPEGNGRIVKSLAERVGSQLASGHAVLKISSSQTSDTTEALVLDVRTDQVIGVRARQVIFAAPQFLAGYLISDLPPERQAAARTFEYGSWLVANLHLRQRPAGYGFPLSWDNVLYNSSSLGYVVATHQAGIDHGATVLTWYYPFCDRNPAVARQQLLEMTWEDCAELALADLERVHPEIRELATRLDVMRWGHAMVQPRPGFLSSPERKLAARRQGTISFAGTDLSGVALMEEAYYHGVRAAEEVLQHRGTPEFESWL